MYAKIYSPLDKKQYSINSKEGLYILNNFIMIGGKVNCKKFKRNKPPKCNDQSGCNWVKKLGCQDVNTSHPPERPIKSPPADPYQVPNTKLTEANFKEYIYNFGKQIKRKSSLQLCALAPPIPTPTTTPHSYPRLQGL